MYNAPEESCEDEYFDVKLALFDKNSKFWIVGNLSTNFMVNGFNIHQRYYRKSSLRDVIRQGQKKGLYKYSGKG